MITSIRLLHIITFNLRFMFYTRTHTKNHHYNFLLKFRNCPYNTVSSSFTPFLLSFFTLLSSTYKTHHIYTNCNDKTNIPSLKRPWVDINTVYSSYRWLFSLVPCRKVFEYWIQTILSQTQGYRKRYLNYY